MGRGINGRIVDFNAGWTLSKDERRGRRDWGGRLAVYDIFI